MSRHLIFRYLPHSLLLLLFLGVKTSFSQNLEAGFHFGYNFNRLTVDQNRLNESVFVKGGVPYHGLSAGIQALLSPPKVQSSPKLKLVSAALLEATLCRCGGNIELSLTNPNGRRNLIPLNYLLYRGDYSIKYVGNLENVQFLLGPTVTSLFFAGVQNSVSNALRESADDQFKTIAFGYELGLATKINTIQISFRYQKIARGIGRRTEFIPTKYNNYQVKLMLHYYFLKKEKGLNWNSIYWK